MTFGHVADKVLFNDGQTPRQEVKRVREHLKIANRDMTEDEWRRVRRRKYDFARLLDDLEAGRVYREDLGAEQLKRLRALLGWAGRIWGQD